MLCSTMHWLWGHHPYFPLVAYALLCVVTAKRQWQIVPPRRHEILEARVGTNLTLVGFSFTVVGLIVTLFQQDLPRVYRATFLFSLSVACFFMSYLLLQLRLKRLFDTLSEAFTVAGLWVTLSGLKALFESFDPLKPIAPMFSVLLVAMTFFIATDIFLKWSDRNRPAE